MSPMKKPHSHKKAVVLLSGGLDSAVALWWAKSKGMRCSALTVDYGQRHKKELQSAARLAKAAKIPHRVVRFSLPWGGSSLIDKRKRLPSHPLQRIGTSRIPSTYVPARNTVFLSLALSWADRMKAVAVVIGANAVDYSGYPDCRPKFIKAFEKTARAGTRMGAEGKMKVSVLAPLLRSSKADIVRWGKHLRVPFSLTWSCYKGGRTPCGRCDSCRLRKKGFDEARIQDDISIRQ